MNLNNVVNDAIDAIKSGGKVQGSVRDIFDHEVSPLDKVIQVVTAIRNDTHDWVTESEEFIGIRRKQVNNVINDISRISRKMAGKSIVCTKRSYPFEYEAREPEVKDVQTVITPIPPVAAASDTEQEPVIDTKALTEQAIRDYLINCPKEAIDRLVGLHGKDETGAMFLDAIKKEAS